MDYVNAIRDECEQKEYHLVLVFLRQSNADVYACVKKLTCCETPIPSQASSDTKYRQLSIFRFNF